jgi:acetyltransferase-like isoleucine patch superfamily enzyme
MDISIRSFVQRFLIPQLAVSVYYLVRYGCSVSLRAEVEWSRNLSFGRGVTISSFTKIKATDGLLAIGKETGFATSCFVAAGSGGIQIGDYCMVGPNVNIVAASYVFEKLTVPFKEQGFVSKGILIGNNVWVGAGTTILDGTVIGDNTVVVANSLLNRRYPPNCILQGNPAKVVLKRPNGAENDEGKDFRTG